MEIAVKAFHSRSAGDSDFGLEPSHDVIHQGLEGCPGRIVVHETLDAIVLQLQNKFESVANVVDRIELGYLETFDRVASLTELEA